MITDYFMLPWKEMQRRKLRSLLTLFGIVVGIAAVIALIMIGQGLQQAIMGQIAAMGSDKLIISAKGNALNAGLSIDAIKITNKDLMTIKHVSGVKQAAGFIYSTAKIEFNDKVRYNFVYGFPTRAEENVLINSGQNYKLLTGGNLEKGDKYKAVAGYEYTNPDLFGKELVVGNKIKIQGQEFKTIGMWQKTGSPPDDSAVIIPLDTYQELFKKDDELGLIIVQINPGEDLALMEERIRKELRKQRHLDEGKEDFTIQSPEQLAAAFGTILTVVQVVLIGIAAISLFVGGIGIMNTMFTAVLQRTKEVGLFKAVGATNGQILLLFLIESGLYGIIGGVIGVIVGVGVAKIAEEVIAYFIGAAFFVLHLNFLLLFGAVLFSFIVGCVSGIAPARRAAKLNPIESLRYE